MRSPDSTLEEYQAKLDQLIAEDSTAIFANYTRAHARCIVQAFLSGAFDSADILAGDFGNDFWRQEPVRRAVLRAVSNGARVRVVSLCTDPESKDCVRRLAEAARFAPCEGARPGKFLYKFANVRPGTQVKHYMIVDRKRYRLEDYHGAGSPAVHAEVCCNGRAKAATLTRLFEGVWDKLSPDRA